MKIVFPATTLHLTILNSYHSLAHIANIVQYRVNIARNSTHNSDRYRTGVEFVWILQNGYEKASKIKQPASLSKFFYFTVNLKYCLSIWNRQSAVSFLAIDQT